jgi:ribosomal protein S17
LDIILGKAAIIVKEVIAKIEETKKIKKLIGMVISDKMDKTIVVEVTRFVEHSKYGKRIKKSKNSSLRWRKSKT